MRTIRAALAAVLVSVCLAPFLPAPAFAGEVSRQPTSTLALPLLAQAPAAAPVPTDQVIHAASNPISLAADYVNPEDAEVPDVVHDVAAAATAGRWLLATIIMVFGVVLGLRKLAPKDGRLSRWLHSTTGLWVWGTILAFLAKIVVDLNAVGTVDAKTFGGVVATAAVTVLLAKIRDSAPTEAAAAAAQKKAQGVAAGPTSAGPQK